MLVPNISAISTSAAYLKWAGPHTNRRAPRSEREVKTPVEVPAQGEGRYACPEIIAPQPARDSAVCFKLARRDLRAGSKRPSQHADTEFHENVIEIRRARCARGIKGAKQRDRELEASFGHRAIGNDVGSAVGPGRPNADTSSPGGTSDLP